jgi:hypothetical protein
MYHWCSNIDVTLVLLDFALTRLEDLNQFSDLRGLACTIRGRLIEFTR